MDDIEYMVGQPVFDVRPPGSELWAPAGQIILCRSVVIKEERTEVVSLDCRREYLAIVRALQSLGVTFRIAVGNEKELDSEVISDLTRMGCRMVGFGPNFFPPSVVFPRDFCTIVNQHLLLNPTVTVLNSQCGGYTINESLYGEGGRILCTDRVAVIANRVIPVSGGGRQVVPEDFTVVTAAGLTVVQIPAPLMIKFTAARVMDKCASYDHIDRMACLLRGCDGADHLVVDPHLLLAHFADPSSQVWEPMCPDQALQEVQRACQSHGIIVHQPSQLSVPYSLNLLQLPDGRVLMTSGEPELQTLVESIVGAGNVTVTGRPIRAIPAWLYAGIRCLVNNFPGVLFKPNT